MRVSVAWSRGQVLTKDHLGRGGRGAPGDALRIAGGRWRGAEDLVPGSAEGVASGPPPLPVLTALRTHLCRDRKDPLDLPDLPATSELL